MKLLDSHNIITKDVGDEEVGENANRLRGI